MFTVFLLFIYYKAKIFFSPSFQFSRQNIVHNVWKSKEVHIWWMRIFFSINYWFFSSCEVYFSFSFHLLVQKRARRSGYKTRLTIKRSMDRIAVKYYLEMMSKPCKANFCCLLGLLNLGSFLFLMLTNNSKKRRRSGIQTYNHWHGKATTTRR